MEEHFLCGTHYWHRKLKQNGAVFLRYVLIRFEFCLQNRSTNEEVSSLFFCIMVDGGPLRIVRPDPDPHVTSLLSSTLLYWLHEPDFFFWGGDSRPATQNIACRVWNPLPFVRALHWTLSWNWWIQCAPLHPISVIPILILSFPLR